jgi:hypothetical protein
MEMKRYRNLSGNSGIEAYEIGEDFVRVRFHSGVIYCYTEASVGARHLEALKRLAENGKGLSTYISRHDDVNKRYVSKED